LARSSRQPGGRLSPTSPSSGKVDRGFEPGREGEKALLPARDRSRLTAPPAIARAARRWDWFPPQADRPALRLGEIDPAMLEGAAGELPRLGGLNPSISPSASRTAATTARPP
jgi:hypothetical protein